MDVEAAVERLLETANLTGDLDDATADQVITWGVSTLRATFAPGDDEATSGHKLAQVMGLMRSAQQIARQAQQNDAEALRFYVQLFLNNLTELRPGTRHEAGSGLALQVADALVGQPLAEAVTRLLAAALPANARNLDDAGEGREPDAFAPNDDPVM
jgi:hypothetical protein